jgi:NDP-sugar pyrophosphorylase family protein
MIAVLLAGGKASRLGRPARHYLKPLFPIGVQPVMNHIIDKLLRIPEITDIYVLTRTRQAVAHETGGPQKVNLRFEFKKWRQVWYEAEPKVKVVYEDTDLSTFKRGHAGALPGVEAFIDFRKPSTGKGKGSLLIIAADNYFDDDLRKLVACAASHPKAIINAYFDFGDKDRLRRKYGAVFVNERGWITQYQEKPEDPRPDQKCASTGIYVFPCEHIRRIKDYMRAGAPGGYEGPGNVLAWLINEEFAWPKHHPDELRTRGIGVFGYELRGEWFDVGCEPDLLAAGKYYLDHYLLRMNTVDDLRLAEMVRELNDKYYLLCKRLRISTEGGVRTIRMFFQGSDPICKYDANFPGDGPTVKEITETAKKAPYWERIHRALSGVQGFGCEHPDGELLDPPILISGGVFLFDSAHGSTESGLTSLDMRRTLIPFLERDPAAESDAGRLTTSAGRVDMLNLRQVCFQELCEEMVFYSADPHSGSTIIRCFVPDRIQDLKRGVLQRLVERSVSIPGIDPERLKKESHWPEADIKLVTDQDEPHIVNFPGAWKVQMLLGQDICSDCDSVIVIPDQDNGTIEFRLAYYANITECQTLPPINRNTKTVGSLLGIADGDGHQRRPFLISANAFQSYYSKVSQLAKRGDKLLELLVNSQKDSVDIVAVGRPGDGRFVEVECRMPVLLLTTAVRYLAEYLQRLWDRRAMTSRGGK